MAFRLVYSLLTVVLLILLVHVFFTMYWLLLEKNNLEPSNPRKTNTRDGDNQQVSYMCFYICVRHNKLQLYYTNIK